MVVALDPFRHEPPASARDLLPAVLAEIAETAAETLELQEVFGRVATSIRRLIPFDQMGVVRVLPDGRAVMHATTVPCAEPEGECSEPLTLDAWSPRFRPVFGSIARFGDAERELDPAFPVDEAILSKGVRSGLWEPFRLGESFGGVWICAGRRHAFDDTHQELLRPIAALLGSAVEHWRLWDVEMRRHERIERLESLLATLATSLDVRELFPELSAAVQAIVPHDLLVLSELNLEARELRVVALAGQADIEPPAGPVPLTADEARDRAGAYELVRDLPAELAGETECDRILLATGMRSWLRVPVLHAGEEVGGLSLFHREPAKYDLEDTEIARRLADRVALMLSHARLAAEAQRTAEARERAERLEATVESLARELQERGRGRVVGVSRTWREVVRQVGRVAAADTTVLVRGESGTGKEVVAQLLHQGSPRAKRPLVAVNCAALPEQLLESELFGHERGAFTGAVSSTIGKLEQAAGGTLFLDEIGEMSPLVQAKLLRVLQEREFQRVGGTRKLKADVRVIAATNRDLEDAIARGAFREDLFYRLNVFEIAIPPLRSRRDDILPLAEAFLDELGRSMGRPAAGISRDARDWLLAYAWPGNVRELRNAIERAILLCDGGLIAREHLPAANGRAHSPAFGSSDGAADPTSPLPPDGIDLEQMERSYVERALAEARGNKSKAARLLGLTRAQLYSRIEKFGLTA